jgi:hypothetical protein
LCDPTSDCPSKNNSPSWANDNNSASHNPILSEISQTLSLSIMPKHMPHSERINAAAGILKSHPILTAVMAMKLAGFSEDDCSNPGGGACFDFHHDDLSGPPSLTNK